MMEIDLALRLAAGKLIEGLSMPVILARTATQIFHMVLVLIAGYGMPGRRVGAVNGRRTIGD